MGGAVDGRRLRRVRMLSTDVDGTMAGNPKAESNFFEAWQQVPAARRPMLVYNSGRLIDDLLGFLPTTRLPPPDILIGGLGTMLFNDARADDSSAYARSLGPAFDNRLIAKLLDGVANLQLQPPQYQNQHKSSWYLKEARPEDLSTIGEILAGAGIQVQLVYSSQRDLDILPAGVNKGAALRWLCGNLGIGLEAVVVAGDSDNDRSMFELPHVRGIIVSNALPELRTLVAEENDQIYCAEQGFADGVLEGLLHFGAL